MTASLSIPAYTPAAIRRCRGKRTHRGMKRAIKVAEYMTTRHGHLFHAYECPDCGGFHVGHANKDENEQFQQLVKRKCSECNGRIPIKRAIDGSKTCSKECSATRQARKSGKVSA